MSNVAKLKKKAVECEQKRQYDQALALYVQVLDESAAGDGEPEVALYNRVGDLLLRVGQVDRAVTYFGKAVEQYAEGGFLNNAIALCNKILRHDPGQTAVHYTLGRISAQKGFRSDAKYHFLEYADRMRGAGELDESFRALKEFADLCPDQDDFRLMLAEQLSREGRPAEAIEQLQMLHEKLVADGRTSEARAAAERMVAIDPAATPRAGAAVPAAKAEGGLVFLDVSWEERPASRQGDRADPAAVPEASILDDEPSAPGAEPSAVGAPVAGLESTALELDVPTETPVLEIDGQLVAADEPGPGALAPPLEPGNAEAGPVTASAAAALPQVDELHLDVAPSAVLDLDLLVGDANPGDANDVEHAGLLPALVAPTVVDELPLVFPDVTDLVVTDLQLDSRGQIDGLDVGGPDDSDEESMGPELTLIMPDALDDDESAAAWQTNGAPLEGLPLLDDPTPAAGSPLVTEAGGELAKFVNLGDWLRDDEPPKSTRMVTDALEPAAGEEFDFDDMLQTFKRGVADNVDEDDYESHYDLGVAFREMGLADEAIAEFQKVLRGSGSRARTYEALGQCFVDKSQYQVAVNVLSRALDESPGNDQQLVGVLYLLGTASEALGRQDEAIAFYQRVFAVDIAFRDVEDRMNALERATR